MRYRISPRDLFVAVVLLLAASLVSTVARAETVLVDSSALVQSTQTFVFPFSVPGAGVLEIELKDLRWPQELASLTLVLSDSREVLQRLVGEGIYSFEIGSAAQLYAHVTGVAQGAAIKIGLFGLNVRFQSPMTPVPLPAAGWMLLAGLGVFGAALRERRTRAT